MFAEESRLQVECPLAWRAWWWGSLLSFGLVCLVAFWPGQLSMDSLVQIQQGRAHLYDNWHPPLMAWLVGLMDQGRFGARLPILLVITAYLLSWWLLSWRISTIWNSWTVIFISVVVLWPPYWALLGTLWKDVWMAIALLSTVTLVLTLDGYPWWALFFLFVGCLFSAALRHNGVVATVPLLIGLGAEVFRPLGWRRHWRWSCVTLFAAAHVAGVLFFNSTLHAVLRVQERYVVQQLLLYDITGISVHTGQNLFRVSPNSLFPFSRLQELYTPASVTPLLFTSQGLSLREQEEDVRALALNWFDVVRNYPWPYLKHRARVFAHQFSLTRTGVCYPFHAASDSNEAELAYHPGLLGWLMWKGLAQVTFLFSGWIYLLVCFGVALGCLVVHCRTMQPVWVLPLASSASGAFYGLAYFFCSVTCDYRMHYWVAIAAGLGVLLFLLQLEMKWAAVNQRRTPSVL